MRTEVLEPKRREVLLGELGKLSAFLRRDFLVVWSYRLAFFTGWAALIVQVVLFYFVGRLVDPSKLPSFGGSRASYMEFVAIGIALSSFLALGLGRVMLAIRNEQLIGTLESLLMTPTAPATLQLGLVFYDLLYVPLRTFIFLGLVALLFGVDLNVDGMGPAIAVLIVFIPFVWGLGVMSASAVLTFRQGSGLVGIAGTLLTLSSGAYFPVHLLPAWSQDVIRLNPIKVALDATRHALLGTAGWAETWPTVLTLLPVGLVSLTAGVLAFRLALDRERRRGTLGLY